MTIRLRLEQLNPGDEFIYQEREFTLLDSEAPISFPRIAFALGPELKLTYIPGGSLVSSSSPIFAANL